MAGKRPPTGVTLSFDWALPDVAPSSSRRSPTKEGPSPSAPERRSSPERESASSASAPPPPGARSLESERAEIALRANVLPSDEVLSSDDGAALSPVEVFRAPPSGLERAAPPPKPQPRVLTVAELGRVVGRSLERTFSDSVWVEGEVSGARPASSGHVYFSMKDEEEEATLDVVLYRSQITPRARALIKDGARVRVRGKPAYWVPRGKLQFIGDRVEPTGKGALLEALEKLKEKLRAEGLFTPERKRPLPHDPRIIGVVTSAHGAVIHDVCKVAFRRGGAHILLAPAQVQGAGAAESIRRALAALQKVAEVDVIVVGRGGGSQDDLWAFNDELLVRDVAACRVPIVSAVGHEVDVTLVDFAADARAATPSQAAEMIVPDVAARRRLLSERDGRLRRAMHARIAEERVVTGRIARAFGDPRLLIASAEQRLDEYTARLGHLLSRRLTKERTETSRLDARLGASHPRERITRDRARVLDITARLSLAVKTDARARQDRAVSTTGRLVAVAPRLVRDRGEQVATLAGRLDAMSPLKVLARGYSIVTRMDDGRAVRDSSEVAVGDRVRVRVDRGSFDAEVARIAEPSSDGAEGATPRKEEPA